MTNNESSSKIPVAIIGGGAIAPLHTKHIVASPTCDLVAIIDPFPSGQALAERISVKHYKTVADLVTSSTRRPEIYYICTPSGLHVKLATEVLQGAPGAKVILIEKPVSTDAASGRVMLRLAQKQGIIIAVGHHRRLNPAITAAKQAIVSGRLGRLTAISGSWALKKNDSYYDITWRASRSAGGGPVWTNFVHDIDLLHHLIGSCVIRVWVTPTVSRRKNEGVGDDDCVEEGAAIMMQFANGVVGTFIISDNVTSPYAWEHAAGDSPLYPQAGSPIDCFRVFGTHGTLTIPDGNLWTYRQKDADEAGSEVGWNVPITREVLPVEHGIPFQLQLESLAHIVTGGGSPVCSGEDGLMAVKVCEAVTKALDENSGLPIDVM